MILQDVKVSKHSNINGSSHKLLLVGAQTPTWLLICSSLSTAQSNIEVPCLLQSLKLEVFCVGALKCWSRIATGWLFPMPPSNHSIATCPNGGVALPISAVSGTVSSKLGTGAATCEPTVMWPSRMLPPLCTSLFCWHSSSELHPSWTWWRNANSKPLPGPESWWFNDQAIGWCLYLTTIMGLQAELVGSHCMSHSVPTSHCA